MKTATTSAAWSDANQAYLVAEFSRLKARLGVEHDEREVATRLEETHAALPAPAAIDTLSELFGLSAFERDVLLLVAGVEMDAELGRVCATALGQSQTPRPQATFSQALAALGQTHWRALADMEPLRGLLASGKCSRDTQANRGSHRGTRAQYSSYADPKRRRSSGSSRRTTAT